MIDTRFIKRTHKGYEDQENRPIPTKWNEETTIFDVIKDMAADGYWFGGELVILTLSPMREPIYVFQKQRGGLS